LYAALARLTQGAHFDDVFGPGPASPRTADLPQPR
jgi:hypothetical protein